MFNILTDNLIRFKSDDGEIVSASLPEVYAALMEDDIAAFPALRPHQRHAWHAFLVQLGAMALHNAALTEPPSDADKWRNIIRALTPEFPDDEPWRLVVDDITKPAFMQPPASSDEREKDYKSKNAEDWITPDEMDSPDTAKNHALKSRSISPTELDSWIFALITGQTTDAHYLQNPAISRISGKGSRLAFSLTHSTRLGIHIRRDIVALLSRWDLIGKDCGTTLGGHPLLWTIAWDGKEQLSINELHPLYIEISRRRRLFERDGLIYARRASGNTARISGRDSLKGRTGDPWIAVNLSKDKAMTLPKSVGFTYRQIATCLDTGDWELPLLCKPMKDERASYSPMYLVARGMAPGDGQNKTGGYYERIVPISHKVKMAMSQPESDSAKDLGRIAKERVDNLGKVERVLKDAVVTFIVGGDNIYDKDRFSTKALNALRNRKEIRLWLKQLNEIVDYHFFAELQSEFEVEQKEERQTIRDKWLWNGTDGVIDHARCILSDAQNALKCQAIQRYRACANSDNLFARNISGNRSGFPDLGYTDRERRE